MSLFKEVFDFSKENKDPFIKWLFRLIFLVAFIVVVFLAYAIIAQKTFYWNGKIFAIRNSDTTKKEVIIKKDSTTHLDKINKSSTYPIKKPNQESANPNFTESDKSHLDALINDVVDLNNLPIIYVEGNLNDKDASLCADMIRYYYRNKGYEIKSFAQTETESLNAGFLVKFFLKGDGYNENSIIIQIGSLRGKRKYHSTRFIYNHDNNVVSTVEN